MQPAPFPSEDERKQWWTLVFAHTSFGKCQTICQQMLNMVDETRHPLYLPFAVTVHAFYCRPFMRQRGASCLQRAYVPARFLDLHDAFTTFRNKVFAHSDSDCINESQRPLNDLLFTVSEDRSDYFTTEPRPHLDHFRSLQELLPLLLEKTFIEFHALHTKYAALIPTRHGDHLFILTGDTLFIDHSPQNPHFRFDGEDQKQKGNLK